ncbi:hypothetical protein VCHENC02_6028, partial [Vibrio harveyi]
MHYTRDGTLGEPPIIPPSTSIVYKVTVKFQILR